ncbi:MAG: HNH endonuclease signature motif containing protein [Nannocystaceae bacterium]
MGRNKHGLSRTIPDDVKREVRQACGFGCATCGAAVYQYEHIDPPFADAHRHDAENLALLCGGCHEKVTRRFWSKDKIWRARANPWSLEHGSAHFAMDIGDFSRRRIRLGKTILEDPAETVISAFGDSVLKISPPERENTPVILSAKFLDTKGDVSLEILHNEIVVNSSSWDTRTESGRFRVFEAGRKLVLDLQLKPGGLFEIHCLDMTTRGGRIKVSSEEAEHSLALHGADGSYAVIGAAGAKIRRSLSIGQRHAHIGASEPRPVIPVRLAAEPVTVVRGGSVCYSWAVAHNAPLPSGATVRMGGVSPGTSALPRETPITAGHADVVFQVSADQDAELGVFPHVHCVVSYGGICSTRATVGNFRWLTFETPW